MALKGIKIDVALHKRLRQRAAEDDSTIQVLMEQAVEAYLSKSPASDNAGKNEKVNVPDPKSVLKPEKIVVVIDGFDQIPVSSSESPWVKRLLGLIRSTNSAVRRAIKYNLLTFGLIRADIREPRRRGVSWSDGDLDKHIQELDRAAAEIESDQAEAGDGDEKAADRRKRGGGKTR